MYDLFIDQLIDSIRHHADARHEIYRVLPILPLSPFEMTSPPVFAPGYHASRGKKIYFISGSTMMVTLLYPCQR